MRLAVDVGPAAAGSAMAARRSALAGPAEGVVVALARALAAAVEQQHAVAVADQHPRVRDRLGRGRGTRSPPRRCATGRTRRAAATRRSS